MKYHVISCHLTSHCWCCSDVAAHFNRPLLEKMKFITVGDDHKWFVYSCIWWSTCFFSEKRLTNFVIWPNCDVLHPYPTCLWKPFGKCCEEEAPILLKSWPSKKQFLWAFHAKQQVSWCLNDWLLTTSRPPAPAQAKDLKFQGRSNCHRARRYRCCSLDFF